MYYCLLNLASLKETSFILCSKKNNTRKAQKESLLININITKGDIIAIKVYLEY